MTLATAATGRPEADSTPPATASRSDRHGGSVAGAQPPTPQLPVVSRTALQFSGEHILEGVMLEQYFSPWALERALACFVEDPSASAKGGGAPRPEPAPAAARSPSTAPQCAAWPRPVPRRPAG